MSRGRAGSGVRVTPGDGSLEIAGSDADGRPVRLTLHGPAARVPVDMRALLTSRGLGWDVALEDAVLGVEAANGSRDFACTTLDDGTHGHRYQGAEGSPTLVLLHALGGNCLTMLPLVELLRGTVTLVCLDLPGHGRTPPAPMTRERSGDWLGGCLDLLGLDRAHLVGHSLGCRVAVSFAALHPGRAQSLTLLAPALSPARDLHARFALSAARVMSGLGLAAVTRRVAGGLFSSMLVGPDATNRTLLRYALGDVLRDQERQRYAGLKAGLEWLEGEPELAADWAALVRGREVRVLCGADDRYCPADLSLREHGVHLEVVPRAGHLLPLEHPAVCAAALRAASGAGS